VKKIWIEKRLKNTLNCLDMALDWLYSMMGDHKYGNDIWRAHTKVVDVYSWIEQLLENIEEDENGRHRK